MCGRPNPAHKQGHGFPPLTVHDFEQLVLETKIPVVVYVSMLDCQSCSVARREFLRAANLFKDRIAFYEVDGEIDPEVLDLLDIKSSPSLLGFTSGTETLTLLGFHCRKELETRLSNHC